MCPGPPLCPACRGRLNGHRFVCRLCWPVLPEETRAALLMEDEKR